MKRLPLNTRWLLFLIGFYCSASIGAEAVWQGQDQLSLDDVAEFTLTTQAQLSGDEIWQSKDALPEHQANQYLHFRVTIHNQLDSDADIRFVIPFPAIKRLTVKIGKAIWQTGDALPFSSRAIELPDYVFPLKIGAGASMQIYGSMQGEILRYQLLLADPLISEAQYRRALFRDMLFFGAMTTLFVVSLIIFFATRYPAYLAFACFSFSVNGWFFRVLGYGFETLWPNAPALNDASYGMLLYSIMLSSAWLNITILKRVDRPLKLQGLLRYYAFALLAAGLLSALLLPLKITLILPLLWFFPFIILMFVVTYLEFKDGSIKARWYAFSMIPIVIGASVVVLAGLGWFLDIDLLLSMMLGIFLTCLMLTVMISTYLIRLLQSQRDSEHQQAEKLELLVKQRTQELQASNRKLNELASIDPLTALPNRRSLDRFVDEWLNQSALGLGIAILDLDHFKRLNDTYGHDVGDLALIEVGKALQPLNDSNIIAGRFGGEEFAIFKHAASELNFYPLLQSVHQRIQQIRLVDYPDISLSASIGWVVSHQNESISDCFRRADQALYQAKSQGRNIIVCGSNLEQKKQIP
jgi:diguanylate cyclase (GGDEF)-like protein